MFDDTYKGMTLDDAAAKAGGYVAYSYGKKLVMEYDFRELSKYCRERGVEPLNLPADELAMFRIDPPLVYPRAQTNID